MTVASLPRPVVALGLAGILPQAACVAIVLNAPEDRWFALAAGCFYAAVILSFLGGMWWMAGLLSGRTSPDFYALAVAPSLIGWGALLPWCFGWRWPGPALLVLAAVLLASPLVDRWLASSLTLPPAWLRLRLAMATGLGLSTLALGLL
ncbi:DUF3429 domain-containing protein [Novosphingobium piscinae]|uniref:DUF3429 domain-containing protein n=1 Tax=Novosphingobium piscinae TaxID=1507448 RepID=A0A7X1KP49_9SPHN|nr:DUF3429 domain-containing protein [Novosphingobium piscinae]MBC2668113.1 DUF3429 domain-containing protein [Novosphingobium piscinae]